MFFIVDSFVYRNEKYGGSTNDHLILDKQKDNRLCDELKKEEIINLPNQTRQESLPNRESQGRFQVEIKTGILILLIEIRFSF